MTFNTGVRKEPTVDSPLDDKGHQLIKRSTDVVGAILLMVCLSPVLVVVYIILSVSGGSAIYGHVRIGKSGKPFTCWKFRSMYRDSQQRLQRLLEEDVESRIEWERSFKLENDPRVTRLGRFLRRSSLDELPQLWNVLCGDMSLVGPRPVVEAELAFYGASEKYYRFVRPGLTGEWQVSGRSLVSYEERVAMDVHYVTTWTWVGDLSLILRTAVVVLSMRGAY